MATQPTTSGPAVDQRAARGAVPSPWILNLPWILRAPIIFLYVDMLSPDDDFIEQLRKVSFTVAALIAPSAVAAGIYNTLTVTETSSAAGWIAKIGAFGMATLWQGTYLLARFNLVASGTLAALLIFSTFAGTFIISIALVDWPFFHTMTVIAIVAQVLRVPCLPLALFLCLVGYIVSAHNNAAPSRGPPEVAMLALPGAILRGYETRIVESMATLIAAVFVLAGLQGRLLESDKLTSQAQRSSDVALHIARLLGDYDTDAAMEVLEEARTAKDADPKLVEALEVLVDNLNKYRPHLPNWLLPKKEQGDAGVASTPALDTTDDTRSVRSNGSRHSSRSLRQGADHATKIGDAAATWFRGGEAFDSYVSLAAIEFTCTAGAATALVDTVHRLAGQTAAAVHCFVGDTVVLTWNAASRAVQSEAKAARMVARLVAYAAESGVRVHGAVVSGKARVQLAGSEGHQKALTLSAEWLQKRLTAVAAVGRRTGHVVCDYATRTSAGHSVVLRAAGALMIGPSSEAADSAPPQRVACYTIGAELGDDQHNDEWMYVLQQHEGSGSVTIAALLGALDAWATGDDDGALHRLPGSDDGKLHTNAFMGLCAHLSTH